MVLPASYNVPPQILEISPTPFIPGGSVEVYEGTLDGAAVCIKRFCVPNKDLERNVAKVHRRHSYFLSSSPLTKPADFL